MNRQIFTLSVLASVCNILSAQITFSTTVDFSGGAESGVAVLPLEDGFIIAGTGWGYEFPEFYDDKLKVTKTDLEGNIVWQKVIGDSAVRYFTDWRSIIKTIDGNIVFSVTRQTDTTSFPMLVKLNPETGDTIFTKYFDQDPILYSTFVRELSDGSLIQLVYDLSDLYGSILIKTTPDAEFIWEKRYGTSTERGAIEFDIYGDTIFLLNSYDNCLPDRYWIRKIDTEGNIIEQNYYSDIGVCPVGARRSRDGGFYGSGAYYPAPPYHSFVYRTAPDGNFLWDYNTNFGDTIISGQLFPSKPIELPNGDLVVAGYYEPNETTAYTGLICKVNTSGIPYWERVYRSTNDPDNDCMIYDVAVLPDKSILCVGGGFGANMMEGFNFWLLKLDSMGCLIPGCDTMDIGVMDLTIDDPGILVFPNPVAEEAIVQISSNTISAKEINYRITDLSGLTLQSTPIAVSAVQTDGGKLRFPLHLEQIPDGIYIMQVFIPGREPLSVKIVVADD